jgi:3-oxoacyl-[acyl-carrier protein] reductase
VVNYATSKEGADKGVGQIVSKGGKAVAVQADMSKPADVSRLFVETKENLTYWLTTPLFMSSGPSRV